MDVILYFSGYPAAMLAAMLALSPAIASEDASGGDGLDKALILGLERIEGPLPYSGGPGARLRARSPGDSAPALSLLLSRSRYWQQDRHLEAIVTVNPQAVSLETTSLQMRFISEDGRELYTTSINKLPGENFAFYPVIPEGFLGKGRLDVVWKEGSKSLGRSSSDFLVKKFPEAVGHTGRVPIKLPNEEGVTVKGLPMTLGVPFPRGILSGTDHLRLVDSEGLEVPLQVSETGRWSKFGSVKWVQCNFLVNHDGRPKEYFLEYGPDVRRSSPKEMVVLRNGGFPKVEAGRLRIDNGLWFDVRGDGQYVKVLDAEALSGAFVEHGDGRYFTLPSDDVIVVEESGPEKVILRRKGWYQSKAKENFCQYDIRYVIFRNSPLLRVFHTWIYTGDSDQDPIRNMGWRLSLPKAPALKGEFLTAMGEAGNWIEGDYLLQYDHNSFAIARDKQEEEYPDGRAPGIARTALADAGLYFGVRDFWQQYPAELEFSEGSLWFHGWPRHGRAREPINPKNVALLRFAHQGKTMDLRLPQEYTEEPIDITHCGAQELERIWKQGKPGTVNAQGVAHTDEFWIYLTPPGEDKANAQKIMQGINDETLRAFVDTKWMIGSGAFHEAHQEDREKYGRFEKLYEQQVAMREINKAEELGIYGKWIYGDTLWNEYDLGNLYRSLRKGHGGYGRLSWLPYARSGNPKLLQRHAASTRYIIDATFCHYVSEEVAKKATGGGAVIRRKGGFWICGALPWGAFRSPVILEMSVQPHQWWSAWHMTGDLRARDMGANLYPSLAKGRGISYYINDGKASRTTEAILQAMIDTYENTFDPWFLTWAHAIAKVHRDAWKAGNWQKYTRNYMAGDREFHRFTGSDLHGAYYLDFVRSSAEPLRSAAALSYAWQLSGDEEFLRRAGGIIADLEELGVSPGLGSRVDNSMELPTALWAFERAGYRPPALQLRFPQRQRAFESLENGEKVFQTPPVAFLKSEGKALPVSLRVRPELASDVRTYTIRGPGEEVILSGRMEGVPMSDGSGIEEIVTIPADAPAGIYHLSCEIRSKNPEGPQAYELRGLIFPVTPPGTPEVFTLTESRMIPSGVTNPFYTRTHAYFFQVPENLESFTVENIHSRPIASIWNPEGGLAWENMGKNPASAIIAVPSEQRGKIWHIRAEGFQMDPKIPPFYAIDKDRWFNPAK